MVALVLNVTGSRKSVTANRSEQQSPHRTLWQANIVKIQKEANMATVSLAIQGNNTTYKRERGEREREREGGRARTIANENSLATIPSLEDLFFQEHLGDPVPRGILHNVTHRATPRAGQVFIVLVHDVD